MMVDTCIICGKIIPEGRQICYDCETAPMPAGNSSLPHDYKNSVLSEPPDSPLTPSTEPNP